LRKNRGLSKYFIVSIMMNSLYVRSFLVTTTLVASASFAQAPAPSIEIKAVALKGACYPAPAGSAYVGGVAYELKNVGKTTIEPQGAKLMLSLSLDGKKVQTVRVANPTALEPGKTAFTVVKGVGQAWFAITAAHIDDYMKTKSLAKPPTAAPATLVVDSITTKDMDVKLVNPSLNAAIVNDATLCGTRPK
jgi:hypothetical protein